MGDQENRRKRIAEIATQIIVSEIERGEVEDSDEAVAKALPEAIRTAKAAYDAAEEYLSG